MRRRRPRLRPAADATAGRRAGTRSRRSRWPWHAAAPGGAGLQSVVRRDPRGHRGTARHHRGRHRGRLMLLLGLTGSIGMGKSAVAARLRALGIGVCDADAEVHKLYAGRAVPLIETAFPGTTADGKVDRQRLSKLLLADPTQFKRLEAIVHPLVFE